MTNEQKLEAVRQKIIETVPEIMELKFGCQIHYTQAKRGRGVKAYFCGEDMYQGKNYIAHFEDEKDCVSMSLDDVKGKKYGIKIIGRTIRISDVLKTIEPFIGGAFKKRINWLNLLALYNFENDDLNLQSPEIWNLLYNLLRK